VKGLLGSLVVRTAIAFLLGLALLQVIIAVAVVWPDGDPALLRLVSPHEADAIAGVLETAAPAQRQAMLDALNNGQRVVRLLPDFPANGRSSAVGRLFGRLSDGYAGQLHGRDFKVLARPESRLIARGAAGVRLAIRLKTGQVVLIERPPVILRRLAARFAFIAGSAALVLLLVMLFCVQQMVLPALRLARATRELAGDIGAPDLLLSGAAEIRTAAAAFNEMKQTIRALMDERTRMLAAIAHDLRTYLTRLRLRAEFIDDPDQRARAVRDLNDMGLLLDDTLMFARDEARRAQTARDVVDLRSEIAAIVEWRREVGEPVDTRVRAGPPMLARCSPMALRRILGNLTDNAVRYGKAAHLDAWRDDSAVWLAVDDDGPGAPPEMFARLVQPFERMEPSRGRQTGGAGLGLAIVKALARSQGGDLVLENRDVGGLRAAVRLPAGD
jgi:signal transduction histidine kinase